MQQHELWSYYFVDHTAQCKSTAAARTHHCNGKFLFCLNIESTTRLWPNTDFISGTWPTEQASGYALRLCHSFKNLSLWPPLFVHTALQFWAFWTCSRATLLGPPGYDREYTRKMIIFIVYSIIKMVITPFIINIFSWDLYHWIQHIQSYPSVRKTQLRSVTLLTCSGAEATTSSWQDQNHFHTRVEYYVMMTQITW